MAKLDPGNKDKYMEPIKDVMRLWLTASSSITYSPKVGTCLLYRRDSAAVWST